MFEMDLSSSCKAHRSLIDIFIVIININNDALKKAWEDRKRVCKAGKCALTEEVGGNLTSKSVDRGEKTRENATWHHPGTKTMAPPVSCVNHGLLCHNAALVSHTALVLCWHHTVLVLCWRHHCVIAPVRRRLCLLCAWPKLATNLLPLFTITR